MTDDAPRNDARDRRIRATERPRSAERAGDPARGATDEAKVESPSGGSRAGTSAARHE